MEAGYEDDDLARMPAVAERLRSMAVGRRITCALLTMADVGQTLWATLGLPAPGSYTFQLGFTVVPSVSSVSVNLATSRRP